MLPRLRALPREVPDREVWRAALRRDGVPEAIVAWLLTSAVRRGDGWAWAWDLDVVDALLDDYFASDFRPFLREVAPAADGGARVVVVRAGRSDRWGPEDLAAAGAGVAQVTLPNAGHWVHVDDPEGTFGVVAAAARRAGVS
jgi:pimeloyl-ACP methyl ester carboxylesterase